MSLLPGLAIIGGTALAIGVALRRLQRRPSAATAEQHVPVRTSRTVDDWRITIEEVLPGRTEARVRAPGAAALGLTLSPRPPAGPGSDPERWLDEHFEVRGKKEVLLRAWLDRKAVASLRELIQPEVSIDGKELVVAVRERLSTPRDLDLIAGCVAALASGGQRLHRRWSRAAERLGARLDDAPEALRLDLAIPGRRGTLTSSERGVTIEVSMARTSPRALDWQRGQPLPEASLAAADPGWIERSASVRVGLDAVEPDLERWRAGVALALALCDDVDRPPELSAFR